MPIPIRIVAEVSKNWTGDLKKDTASPLISKVFEDIIATNAERGYTLESWKYHSLFTGAGIVETIIAVFVR